MFMFILLKERRRERSEIKKGERKKKEERKAKEMRQKIIQLKQF